MDIQVFSRMIGDFYREAAEANGWEQLFTQLGKQLNFDSTSIMMFNPHTGETNHGWAIGHPQEQEDAYDDHYAQLDPWGPAILPRPQSQFFACDDLYPDKEFVNSEVYYDGLRPWDIRWGSGCYFDDAATGQSLCIAHYRGHAGQPFGKQELENMNLFAPHIKNALTIFLRAREAGSITTSLEAIANINNCAAFVVDENDRIIVKNDNAELMLRAGTARLSHQRLYFESHELTKAAQQLITGMRRFYRGESPNAYRFAKVGGSFNGYQLRVETIPLAVDLLGEQRLGVLLMVKPDAKEIRINHAGLKYLFGLTGTESEVVCLFCLGSSAPEIASALKVKESTVRSHIKAAYLKIGVTKQSELVATVLKSLAADY